MLGQVPRPALGTGYIGIMEKNMETKGLGCRANCYGYRDNGKENKKYYIVTEYLLGLS